jgi:[acyl-carrier-protein] S-malonyltransferase
MKPAAEKLAEYLNAVTVNVPQVPVLHNADVASYNDASDIKSALVRQLYSPVRWVETVQKIAAGGIGLVAECGPGKVLTGLNKRIVADMSCHALTSVEALEEFKGLIV